MCCADGESIFCVASEILWRHPGSCASSGHGQAVTSRGSSSPGKLGARLLAGLAGQRSFKTHEEKAWLYSN